MTQNPEGGLDAGGLEVALVVSRFNDFVTDNLLAAAEACLDEHGGSAECRTVVRVPGAWEIPHAAKKLANTGKYEAIIALGALIRGETPHFDVLAAAVARGLGQVGLDSGVPVIFGVLTTETVEQARRRSGPERSNKGREAALAAIEMVQLDRALARSRA